MFNSHIYFISTLDLKVPSSSMYFSPCEGNVQYTHNTLPSRPQACIKRAGVWTVHRNINLQPEQLSLLHYSVEPEDYHLSLGSLLHYDVEPKDNPSPWTVYSTTVLQISAISIVEVLPEQSPARSNQPSLTYLVSICGPLTSIFIIIIHIISYCYFFLRL